MFGEVTLHERISGGASGHETDKRSASSPAGTRLLAKGLNPDDGGAEITIHETPQRGSVFSVGSITWVSALFTDASRLDNNAKRTDQISNEHLIVDGDVRKPPAHFAGCAILKAWTPTLAIEH